MSLKNCGASNWEPKKSLTLGPFQKTSYFAIRFTDTPKFSFFQNHGAQNLTPMVQWSFFLIEPPEAKTMGAIAQNESPEAKTMGAIVQKGQNHGSYRSKRSPRGHLDEAPMEMGLP